LQLNFFSLKKENSSL